MANWCCNNIVFDNFKSPEKRKELLKWVEENESSVEPCGRIPEFVEKELENKSIHYEGAEYLFDLFQSEEDATAIYVQCETKWSPPLGVLCIMAKYYQCDFELSYEEFGCLIYGESKYDLDSDTLLDRAVDSAEWPDTPGEEDDNFYENVYESLDEILMKKPFISIPYYYDRSNS
jgi:hypothetical protein